MKKIIFFVFLLGISLGLIISSTINLLQTQKDKSFENTKEKEKKLAIEKVDEEVKKTQEESPKEDIQIDKKEIIDNTLNEKEKEKEEFATITIEENDTSSQIADILYEKELISSKEDFKILFNLKTLDMYKAGEVITQKGIISKGWKVDLLLSMLNKNYNKVLDNLYTNKLIDDKDSFDFTLRLIKENKKIVPGEKVIKRGMSMKEIIDIITK